MTTCMETKGKKHKTPYTHICVVIWGLFWLYELIMSSTGRGFIVDEIRAMGHRAEEYAAGYRDYNENAISEDEYGTDLFETELDGTGTGAEAGADQDGGNDAAVTGTVSDAEASGGDAYGNPVPEGADAKEYENYVNQDGGMGSGSADAESPEAGSGETDGIIEEEPEEEFVPVPYYFTADESYFDDALFIGDSRMMGLWDYVEFGNATFLCDNGYSIANFQAGRAVRCQNTGSRTTPKEIMADNTFGKVYIMLGTNDCTRRSPDSFREGYAELVDLVRKEEPDAIIFTVANLNMSEKGVQENRSRGFDNEIMGSLNNVVAEFADGESSFFLNFNPLFTDENGYVLGKYTFDGFHVYAAQYQEMGDYIKEHAVAYTTP